MKKIRIVMIASAFAVAIGGAAVTNNAKASAHLNPAHQQAGASCIDVQTDCTASGNTACTQIFEDDQCVDQLYRD